MPAQLCAVIDTCSTVLVSGSQSTEHHCHLTKIVPGAGVASGAIFILSCFCGGLSSDGLCFSFRMYYDLHLMKLYLW